MIKFFIKKRRGKRHRLRNCCSRNCATRRRRHHRRPHFAPLRAIAPHIREKTEIGVAAAAGKKSLEEN